MNSLSILGKPYTVERVDVINGDPEQMGEVIVGGGTISILSKLNKQFSDETLLHEIIHTINDELFLGLKETQIIRLSVALYAVYRENNLKINGIENE